MKKTTHYKGHRWTTDELRLLMKLWSEDAPMDEISAQLKSTPKACEKMLYALRKQGVPLARRHQGHQHGVVNKCWTNEDVQYLLRRRIEKATAEEIAMELGRTRHAVEYMVQALRKEGVPVAMRGNGVRRLWDADKLKSFAVQTPDCATVEQDSLWVTAQ